jgi:Cytochrome oxidase complex assembly protein 1
MTTFPSPPVPRKNWFSRNWKWFVPLGCLSLIVLVAIGIAGLVGIVFSAMKSSDVYRESLTRVQHSPAVMVVLGTPIEAGWLMSGNIHIENDTGQADIEYPVSGPRAKGKVHVVAAKANGKWIYSRMTVQPDTGAEIDVLRGQ